MRGNSIAGVSINRHFPCMFNTLRPRRNEQHFADDIFKRIFFNENVWISIKISQRFVPKGPINNIPVLVQIMAWRRSGDKPLSEPMMVRLLTHICVARPQWVKGVFTQIAKKPSKPCIIGPVMGNWWLKDSPTKGQQWRNVVIPFLCVCEQYTGNNVSNSATFQHAFFLLQ